MKGINHINGKERVTDEDTLVSGVTLLPQIPHGLPSIYGDQSSVMWHGLIQPCFLNMYMTHLRGMTHPSTIGDLRAENRTLDFPNTMRYCRQQSLLL